MRQAHIHALHCHLHARSARKPLLVDSTPCFFAAMAQFPLYEWQGVPTTERDLEAIHRAAHDAGVAEIARAKWGEQLIRREQERFMENEIEELREEWKVKKEMKEEVKDFEDKLVEEAKRRTWAFFAKEDERKEKRGEQKIVLRCNTPPVQVVKEEVVNDDEAMGELDETLEMLCGLEEALSGIWQQPLSSADLRHLALD